MQENKGFVSGRILEKGLIDWSDCQFTKEEIDEVIKPFCSKEFLEVESIIYVSSSTQ